MPTAMPTAMPTMAPTPPSANPPTDRTLFQGTATAVGEFRCPVGHPAFTNSGPTERCIVVFPRTSVWINHEGSRPFVADPNIVTIYNRAQRYERAPLSPEGDRCDWFAVTDDVARGIVAAFDPKAADRSDGPFRFESAPSTPALYFAQRRLLLQLRRRAAEPLEVETEVVDLVSGVLALAYQRALVPLERRGSAGRRHRDIVENAKKEIVRTFTGNRSVSDIARAVGTSVFHLCRVFRAQTGRTMHEYRTELRLRAALERMADGGVTLSVIAHDLGFASHSHLVRLFRRQLGAAPGKVREQLRAG